MSVITARIRAALVAVGLVLLLPAPGYAQKALVYCPVGIDGTGCNAILAALGASSGGFPGGVDGGYDGTGSTIDLATADLSGYAVLVIPSLADGGELTPYGLLSDPAVSARLKAAFPGRAVVWSGTPDRGSTNRTAKDGLIRNLARWAGGPSVPGLVVLQDNSDDISARYNWLSGVSPLTITADSSFETYANVEVLTAIGRDILTNSSGLQIGYANMASFGLVAGGDMGAVSNDATGGRSGRSVLLTSAGEAGAVIATIRTDREDYPPGDTVIVTGSGWEPGETVYMLLHEDPLVHGDRTLTATADEQGNIFNNQFVPEEHDLGVRFVLTATGQTSGRTAQTTFTDNRAITAATVNGGATVTVAPGATITASVTVNTTTGGGGGEDWMSTSWSYATTSPGTTFNTPCANTPDHQAVGTFTESFSTTAPTTPGTYNAYFLAWRTAGCGNNPSNLFILPNAVVVSAATKLAFTSTAFSVVFNQCSPQITVQTQNSGGAPTNPGSNTTVNLTTTSVGGAFYSNNTCTTPITSVVISTAGNTASFFYKDANVGGPTLTAAATGFTSANQAETITQASTATTVASSLNPSGYGQSVTFTATVNSAVSGVISGSVTFKDGAATLGTAPLSCALSCTASLATSSLDVPGSPHGITAQYGGNLNFAGSTSAVLSQTVNPRAITVTADAQTKVYGDPDPELTYQITTGSLVAGDAFTGALTRVTGEDIGTYAIQQGNLALGPNYTLSFVGADFEITGRPLTVTATAANKEYDATAAATVTLADNRISGDVFTVSYTAASFADKHAGNGKQVTVSGISISGADAGNYGLANTTALATANITQRPLVVTATGISKEYDGTTDAEVTLADDRLAGDVFTVSYTAAFADKNVANGKPVTVSGLSLSGADAGNYAVGGSITTSANITARPLTVTATGVDKVYDGTTTATVTLSDDRVAGDGLTTAYSAANFANKTVGNSKPISVTGISISGGDAGNYALANTTATAAANITPVALAGSITAEDKEYDGTTAADIATRTLGDGVISGDEVILTGGTATFADKNVGDAKTVTATGLTLSGADAENYTVNSTAATTADITPRPLTVTATGVNKEYDGTTAATVTLSDDRVPDDVLTINYTTASFADKNAANGKPISVSGISISGDDAANYTLTNTTATATANITRKPLDTSITADDKVYDGTTDATIATRTLGAGVIAGDDVTLAGGTATFADKNVADDKTVTATGLTLTGGDAGNYSITGSATTTADITARTLTVTATGVNKVYDGSTDATVTLSDDRVGGDLLTTAYTAASFADKNVGDGKPVSVSGISVSGGDAGNYVLGNTTATTTANITQLALTSHITADNKEYDGTTAATILTRTLTDVLSGDDVSLVGGTANFADKNAGAGKTVTATGLTLAGDDAGNYSITGTATTTADITQRPVTVSAQPKTKVYGDPEPLLTYAVTTGSVVAGDAFAGGLTRDPGQDVGSYAINQGSLTLGPNYIMAFVGSTLSVTPAPLAVTANSKTKIYADAFPVLDGTIVGIKNGDNVSAVYSAGSGGTYNALTPVGVYAGVIVPTLVDPDGRLGNYTVTPTNGTLTVLRATPVYSTLAAPTIVFGATPTTLSGKLSYTGAGVGGATVYPGGSLAITVNGVTQSASINSLTGSFSVAFPTGSLPASGTGHTITYAYSGSDPNFNPASNNSQLLKVLYNTAVGHAFLQPINPNLTTGNRSSFKIGSTIPAKFELFMPDGVTKITTASATISVVKIDNSPETPINEEVISLPPDVGTTFKVSSGQYHYNLGTKGWTAGTYRIIANLDDGSKVTAEVDGRSK